jgi:hypothetical protein
MMDLLGREWYISAAYQWALHTGQDWHYLPPRNQHDIEIDNAAIFTGRLYGLMRYCLSIDKDARPSAMDVVEELTGLANMGINLSAREERCRCCHCNFDTRHAEKIKLMLKGEYVDIKDTAREFIDTVIAIDFMPTLRCRLHDDIYLLSTV